MSPVIPCRHVALDVMSPCIPAANAAELPTAAAATTTDDDERGEDNAEAGDMHDDAEVDDSPESEIDEDETIQSRQPSGTSSGDNSCCP